MGAAGLAASSCLAGHGFCTKDWGVRLHSAVNRQDGSLPLLVTLGARWAAPHRCIQVCL